MRFLMAALLVSMALAACFESPVRLIQCEEGLQDVQLFLDNGDLVQGKPSSGEREGNAFSQAFLVDEADHWMSAPMEYGVTIQGDVVIEYWVRSEGSVAPIAIGGDPGEGYHFFNQFGSDRTFQPDYAIEYATVIDQPGQIRHYIEVLTMPAGGFVVERGDRVRLLLTSLVLDGGHTILTGGDTPSHVRFEAVCFDDPVWQEASSVATPISLQGNQGLLTGAVPEEEGFNVAHVPFTLDAGTDRLTVRLEQTSDPNPAKDDVDMVILAANGTPIYSAGSPFVDETAILWRANLDAFMPPGDYVARVDSYSGGGYEGVVTVVQDVATAQRE